MHVHDVTCAPTHACYGHASSYNSLSARLYATIQDLSKRVHASVVYVWFAGGSPADVLTTYLCILHVCMGFQSKQSSPMRRTLLYNVVFKEDNIVLQRACFTSFFEPRP